MTADTPAVHSLDEAAELLKLPADTVRKLALRRELGHLKTGRTYTFTNAHLSAYLEAHEILATPANPHGLTNAATRRVRRK